MSSDVQSVNLTADGVAVDRRCRVRAVYMATKNVGGQTNIRNGQTGASPIVHTITTPAAATIWENTLPDRGILCPDGVYVDVGDTDGVTVVFEG